MLAEHQIEAVERSVALLAARGGLILADEVGLGKSYIAAEVMRRWHQLAGELELIIPAALLVQWRDTLGLFDVHARIFTHDALANEAFMPLPGRRLVVVDEAHAFRNPGTRRYASLARRTAAAQVMLITATPVCNSMRDLEALVRLLARDDLLADAGVPSIDVAFEQRDAELIERIVSALVVRRDRRVLPEGLQFGVLDRRVVRHPVPELPLIEELRFPLVGESALLRRFLRRRLESSEAALIESLRRQLRFYDRALAALLSGRALPKRDYRRAFGGEEDRDAFQEVLFWELFAPPGEIDPSVLRQEVARLDALLEQAQASPQEKRRLLLELVARECEPTLIFTISAATARDLHSSLTPAYRCGLVTARERTREAVLRAFVNGRLDIVVTTDMAAEGLNLQRAGVIVHYDIPWNPVKLDQRNGRAHRIGQARPSVKAIYFLPQTRETKIVETIARKNRMRKRTLRSAPVQLVVSPTLPPRLVRSSAYLRLLVRHACLPDSLARRHKAGLELILEEMSREYLDERRIEYLVALVETEA